MQRRVFQSFRIKGDIFLLIFRVHHFIQNHLHYLIRRSVLFFQFSIVGRRPLNTGVWSVISHDIHWVDCCVPLCGSILSVNFANAHTNTLEYNFAVGRRKRAFMQNSFFVEYAYDFWHTSGSAKVSLDMRKCIFLTTMPKIMLKIRNNRKNTRMIHSIWNPYY